MSSPSRSSRPDTPAPAMTSCMRLSVRRKVDFPQPDGPIRAVTRLASTVSETFSMARVDPYQALTPITSIDLDMVLPGRSYQTGCAGTEASGQLLHYEDDKGAETQRLDTSPLRRAPR